MALTVPTQNCDIDPELALESAVSAYPKSARPKMLSGSGVRWLVFAVLAIAVGLSLVLALVGSLVQRTNPAGAGNSAATVSVNAPANSSLTSFGAGQWLLRTKTGDCVVSAQVSGSGQLQLVSADPDNPACRDAASLAR